MRICWKLYKFSLTWFIHGSGVFRPIPSQLFGQECPQRMTIGRQRSERAGAQQTRRVGQQSPAPGQAQTVEKRISQTQLFFLIRLRRLNPRPHVLQQELRGASVERQLAQQCLVRCRRVNELLRTLTLLPAPLTQRPLCDDAKPLLLGSSVVAQPAQGRSLRTDGPAFLFKGRRHFHVRTQIRQHRHLPVSLISPFDGRCQIGFTFSYSRLCYYR